MDTTISLKVNFIFWACTKWLRSAIVFFFGFLWNKLTTNSKLTFYFLNPTFNYFNVPIHSLQVCVTKAGKTYHSWIDLEASYSMFFPFNFIYVFFFHFFFTQTFLYITTQLSNKCSKNNFVWKINKKICPNYNRCKLSLA